MQMYLEDCVSRKVLAAFFQMEVYQEFPRMTRSMEIQLAQAITLKADFFPRTDSHIVWLTIDLSSNDYESHNSENQGLSDSRELPET